MTHELERAQIELLSKWKMRCIKNHVSWWQI